MLLEILVQVGKSSTGLDFSITVTVRDARTCRSLICRHVHSKEKHISPLSCPSICLFKRISVTSSGCIFVKFDVGAFFNICE